MEDEKMDDEKFDIEDDESDGVKSWFSDNLRIIISIIIVVVIAGGVYSYSKRSQAPATTDQNQATVQDQSGNNSNDQNAAVNPSDQSQTADNSSNSATQQPAQNGNSDQSKTQVSSTTASQETETSFVETAGAGDGTIRLARTALANYLEKNPDSTLTAEHKIFIEDYLSKQVGSQRLAIGATKEFSKDLISQAITASKNLTQNQLNNLHKYAVRVPSLS
jgi:predicted negative regulator of RcsB-dependent stress response